MKDDDFKAALYLKTGIMFVLVHLKTRIFPKYWNLHKNVTFLPSVTITCLSLIMFLGCCKLSFKLTSSNIFVCGSVHTGCLWSLCPYDRSHEGLNLQLTKTLTVGGCRSEFTAAWFSDDLIIYSSLLTLKKHCHHAEGRWLFYSCFILKTGNLPMVMHLKLDLSHIR